MCWRKRNVPRRFWNKYKRNIKMIIYLLCKNIVKSLLLREFSLLLPAICSFEISANFEWHRSIITVVTNIFAT